MKKIFITSLIILLSGLPVLSQDEMDIIARQDSILKELQHMEQWYKFETERFTLIPLAVLALDVNYFGQDPNSKDQVGDQSSIAEPGEIRAIRIGLIGNLKLIRTWRWVASFAYRGFEQGFNSDSTSDFTLYDLRLDIPTLIGTFAIGKMKEPISMQRTASLIYLGGTERGMNLDGLLPSRNVGITYYGNIWENRILVAAGAFNQSIFPGRNTKIKDATNRIVMRGTINPFYNYLENHDLHIGGGYVYSDFKEGARSRQHPENIFASRYIDTGPLEGRESYTRNLELAYRYKNLLLTSEYTSFKIINASLGNPDFRGWFVQADYALFGETRPYIPLNATFSKIKPAKNVKRGGPGALELTFRYSTLDYNTRYISGGEMSRVSLITTWYPTILSKFQIGYGYVTLDRFGKIGHTHMFQARFSILIG